MNKQQMLLICLIEECAEVSQRATKLLRFGPYEVEPGQAFTNIERLEHELVDLNTIISELHIHRLISILPNQTSNLKREKLDRYFTYSNQLGILK